MKNNIGKDPQSFTLLFNVKWINNKSIIKAKRGFNIINKLLGIYQKYELITLSDPEKVGNGYTYNCKMTKIFYYILWIKVKTKIL